MKHNYGNIDNELYLNILVFIMILTYLNYKTKLVRRIFQRFLKFQIILQIIHRIQFNKY